MKGPRRDLLLAHMLLAGLLVAQYWNSTRTPSLHEWWRKMYNMVLMSKLTTMFKVRNGVVNEQLIFKKHCCFTIFATSGS